MRPNLIESALTLATRQVAAQLIMPGTSETTYHGLPGNPDSILRIVRGELSASDQEFLRVPGSRDLVLVERGTRSDQPRGSECFFLYPDGQSIRRNYSASGEEQPQEDTPQHIPLSEVLRGLLSLRLSWTQRQSTIGSGT